MHFSKCLFFSRLTFSISIRVAAIKCNSNSPHSQSISRPVYYDPSVTGYDRLSIVSEWIQSAGVLFSFSFVSCFNGHRSSRGSAIFRVKRDRDSRDVGTINCADAKVSPYYRSYYQRILARESAKLARSRNFANDEPREWATRRISQTSLFRFALLPFFYIANGSLILPNIQFNAVNILSLKTRFFFYVLIFFFKTPVFRFYVCRKCKHRFIGHLPDYIPDRIVISRYCVHVIATRYGSVFPAGYTEFLTIQTPLKFADVRRLCDTMPLREIGCPAGFLSAAYNARDVFSQCYCPPSTPPSLKTSTMHAKS